MPPTSSVRLRTRDRDRIAESRLMEELQVPRLAAAVLVSRGFAEPEKAHEFLNPNLDRLGDPETLPDFEPAAEIVLGAIQRRERIFVHGDYDVDGVTSAALFSRFLTKVGADVHTHVPHRLKEGYGIHLQAVEEARAMGAKVFLTCDCGISAHEQVEAAKEAGMKVVVTDHHTVPPSLPQAAALINPHRSDSRYPFRDLSGVGVVFRFCEGLAKRLDMPVEGYRRAYLDLTVLGTVADVMPIVGENRIIARHGLKCLWETKKEGLLALMKVSGLVDKVEDGLDTGHIGFQIGPRLNATGRIDDAARALDLLLSRDYAESVRIAQELERLNQERKARQEASVQQAIRMIDELGLHQEFAIVLGSDDWHSGIIGLVAGKVRELYNRPAFIVQFNPETGELKGSARSIPGFHLADAIRSLHPLIEGGGHAMAAGFSGSIDRFDEIREALQEIARRKLSEEDLLPLFDVDAIVDGDEVTFQSIAALQMLQPFGTGNDVPVFGMRNVRLDSARPTKNERVAMLELTGPGGSPTKGVTFSQGPEALEWAGSEVDIVFRAELDRYNGRTYPKFRVEYMSRSEG